MAHFAQLDDNNIVMQVIVINNHEIIDENGNESEEKGISFCRQLLGSNTNWKQTSYNGKFRGFYAGIGYSYNAEKDMFMPPKPFPSWVWDDNARGGGGWIAPNPYPILEDHDERLFLWDEETLEWKEHIPASNEN